MLDSGKFVAIEQEVMVALYNWLARVFSREQTTLVLAGYQSEDGKAALSLFAETPQFRKDIHEIIALTENWKDLEKAEMMLAVEYSRLFLIGGPEQVPAHESVYTSKRARICQQATTDMENMLRRFGMSAAGFPEPADHIGIELEFLASLTAAGTENGEAEQARRELLSRHLLVWAPEFCRLCALRDRTGFYSAAARILNGTLELERQALKQPAGGALPPPAR